MHKVNLLDELARIDEYWSQRIVGEANGQLIKLAKGVGETRWHKHEDQDELFIVCYGCLTIQLREATIDLLPGEMFVVPRGIEHCPRADEEAGFLIAGLNVTSTAAGGKPNL